MRRSSDIKRRRSTLFDPYVLNAFTINAASGISKVNGVKSREYRSVRSLFRYHVRTLLAFQIAFVLLAAACVAFYVWARYAAFPCDLIHVRTPTQNSTTSDANMRNAVPNVVWIGFFHDALFTAGCVCPMYWAFAEVISVPSVALTFKQKWMMLAICTPLNVLVFLVLFSMDTRLDPISATIGMFTRSAMLISFGMINSQNLAQVKPHSAFRRTTFLRLLLKATFLQCSGFLISVAFAATVFPVCQNKLKEFTCSQCQVVRLGSELLLVFLFFSVWQPLWKQSVSKAILTFSMYCRPRTADQEHSVVRWYMSFSMDLLFLVFGRGVISTVSSLFVVVMLILKDSIRHVWDYGFKYMDEYIILMLKAYMPEERKTLKGIWLYIVRFIEWFMRIYDAPNRIATTWSLPVDCQDILNELRMESDNDVFISLGFDDICVTLKNLPPRVSNDPPSDRAFPPIMSERPPHMSSRSIERHTDLRLPLQNLPGRISNDPQEVSGAESDRPVAHGVPGQKRQSLVGPTSDFTHVCKRSEYPSFPHIPVSAQEIENLRSVTQHIHLHIFERYQSRALAKFYTSFLLLAVPLFASFTNVRYVPGYVNPLEETHILFAGCLYMVTDIVEWLIITFGVYYKYEGIHDLIGNYRVTLQSQKYALFLFFSTAVVFGVFLFSSTIQPFNAAKFAHKYPRGDLETIIETCKPFFRNFTKAM